MLFLRNFLFLFFLVNCSLNQDLLSMDNIQQKKPVKIQTEEETIKYENTNCAIVDKLKIMSEKLSLIKKYNIRIEFSSLIDTLLEKLSKIEIQIKNLDQQNPNRLEDLNKYSYILENMDDYNNQINELGKMFVFNK